MITLKEFLIRLLLTFILAAIACVTYNYSLRIIFELPYINVLQMWLIRETVQILINSLTMEEPNDQRL